LSEQGTDRGWTVSEQQPPQQPSQQPPPAPPTTPQPPQQHEPCPDLEILGWKITFPRTRAGMGSLITVCAAVLGIFAILFVFAKKENLRTVAGVVQHSINASGATETSADVYQASFWTPSPRTGQPVPGAQVPPAANDSWGPVSEARVQVFGDSLFAKGLVIAYRRYEIAGRGRTPPKWGYWWVVTLTHPLDRAAFARFYARYWNARGPIFVEELGSAHGAYVPGGD